jgi:hypothetical protein
LKPGAKMIKKKPLIAQGLLDIFIFLTFPSEWFGLG